MGSKLAGGRIPLAGWWSAIAAGLACLIALAMSRGVWEGELRNKQHWEAATRAALASVLVDAMLVDERGRPLRNEPFGVLVGSQSSEPALRAGLAAAVKGNSLLRHDPQSAHRLAATGYRFGDWRALQLELRRRDWVLRPRFLVLLLDRPWIPAVALLFAVFWSWWKAARVWAMPVAAGLSWLLIRISRQDQSWHEIFVKWQEWPDPFYRQSLGRLGGWVDEASWQVVLVAVVLFALAGGIEFWRKRRFAAREDEAKGVFREHVSPFWAQLAWWAATAYWIDAALRSGLAWSCFGGEAPGGSALALIVALGLGWLLLSFDVWKQPR